jgi:hypothetical protein
MEKSWRFILLESWQLKGWNEFCLMELDGWFPFERLSSWVLIVEIWILGGIVRSWK